VLALGLLLQGIARGSMTALTILVLMDTRNVGVRRMGAAGGLFFSASEMGGVLGPVAIGTLYDWTGGFAAALDVLTGVCGALMLLLWILRRATVRWPG
jgi:hypothetical protein